MTMKRSSALFLALSCALCAPGFATAATPASRAPISAPADTLQWQALAGGIRYANVRGNLTGNGPYEAFVEFPAGFDNPHHRHTQALPSVVLSGVFYAIFDDGKKVLYPAGSYYLLPARLPHRSGCEPGANCLLFQYQSDRFDLVPTAAK